LAELNIISNKQKKSNLGNPGNGCFYDWINCNTEFDKNHKDASIENKKYQQRLRYSMMKVILSYVDDIDVSPERFKSIAKKEMTKELETLLTQTRIPLYSLSGQSTVLIVMRF